MTENKEQQGTVFCPEARCLSPEEVAALPGDKRQAAQETGKDGFWLGLFCPGDQCQIGGSGDLA
jgi:hypothetical protein